VNAAYLMLTTAWLAGQTPAPAAAQPAPAPAPAPIAAPVVSSSIGGCNGGCGGYATGGYGGDCCGSSARGGLLARLCHKRSNDCGCESACSAPVAHHRAPACCAPVQTCAPAPSVGCGCEAKKPGLFARLHAMCHKDKGCGCEQQSSCGCGSNGGVWTGTGGWTGTGAEPIQAAPKPGTATPPQKMPTAGGGTPMTINGVIRDVTPVVAPRLSIEQEGPRQPF